MKNDFKLTLRYKKAPVGKRRQFIRYLKRTLPNTFSLVINISTYKLLGTPVAYIIFNCLRGHAKNGHPNQAPPKSGSCFNIESPKRQWSLGILLILKWSTI